MKQTQVKTKGFLSFVVVEKEKRDEIDFTKIGDDALLKLIRISGAEGSPATDEFIDELIRRAGAGMIIPEFEHQIKPIDNLPAWLKKWPWKLLWKQRPR